MKAIQMQSLVSVNGFISIGYLYVDVTMNANFNVWNYIIGL